jgi:hypothetical protein
MKSLKNLGEDLFNFNMVVTNFVFLPMDSLNWQKVVLI